MAWRCRIAGQHRSPVAHSCREVTDNALPLLADASRERSRARPFSRSPSSVPQLDDSETGEAQVGRPVVATFAGKLVVAVDLGRGGRIGPAGRIGAVEGVPARCGPGAGRAHGGARGRRGRCRALVGRRGSRGRAAASRTGVATPTRRATLASGFRWH